MKGSSKKVWWKCPVADDHELQAPPGNQEATRAKCPFCRNFYVSADNSLESLYPVTAELWHPTKNVDLTPRAVTAHSNKKVWWKCPEAPDHEWESTVGARTSARGCPFCQGRRLSFSSSFENKYPELVAQWHPPRNGDFSHKSSDVRAVLAPLSAMPDRTGYAILAVLHLNKRSSETNGLYRITASLDFPAASRSVLVVGKHPDDSTKRVLVSVKSNLSAPPDALGYHITEEGNCTWDAVVE